MSILEKTLGAREVHQSLWGIAVLIEERILEIYKILQGGDLGYTNLETALLLGAFGRIAGHMGPIVQATGSMGVFAPDEKFFLGKEIRVEEFFERATAFLSEITIAVSGAGSLANEIDALWKILK